MKIASAELPGGSPIGGSPLEIDETGPEEGEIKDFMNSTAEDGDSKVVFVNADDVGETIINCVGADVDDDVDDDVQSSGDEAEFKAVISPHQSELKQEAMDTSSPSFHRPGSPSYTPAISDWSD